ncbi:hypothetical protein BSR29_04365 [Boudabousia liubingyangii]|uniref:Uncharacterized protein n=1 Tax=Boudabousia liubingyangii TaxID=1921764 RepID=A0A1Q5PNE4_9ACTO|nr:hypothetical protein [Boudabousia liubingyangii]OKL49071.1 hypothetical protein BSR29_04365 [Boudabousia liubingyangii]
MSRWFLPFLSLLSMGAAAVIALLYVPYKIEASQIMAGDFSGLLSSMSVATLAVIFLMMFSVALFLAALLARASRKLALVALVGILLIGGGAGPVAKNRIESAISSNIGQAVSQVTKGFKLSSLKLADVPMMAKKLQQIAAEQEISPLELLQQLPEAQRRLIPNAVYQQLVERLSQ